MADMVLLAEGGSEWGDYAGPKLATKGRSHGGESRTMRIPIGNGYGAGIVLRVRFPDYFERISRRRAGWGSNTWADIERVLERANARMADELQLLLVEALQEGRVQERKGASTGRLEAALLDPRNRQVSGRRFGVGRVSFLNRSQAKYWRQIDQGSRVHLFQENFYGSWLSPGGQAIGHTRGRRSDRFVSAGSAGANKSLTGRGVITNPIVEQQYFERAWRKFNPRNRALGALREAITEVLGIPMKGVKNSWDATIATMTR